MAEVDFSLLVEEFELLSPQRAVRWPWVLAALVLALALLLWGWRRRRRAASGSEPPAPEELARAALRACRGLLGGADPVPFLSGVQAALRQYTDARFSLPARALTRAELSRRWEETGLERGRFEELDAVFSVCDQGKYQGGRLYEEDRRYLLALAYRWVRAVRPRPVEENAND